LYDTKYHSRHKRVGWGTSGPITEIWIFRLPARAKDADAVSRREIVAPKLMSTMVAVRKLEAHGVFATTAGLEQPRELIDRLS
jgi:hypothetical protein